MPHPDYLTWAISRYSNLETAYQNVLDYIDYPPEDLDSWLINLQNHLLWKSYIVGRDDNADTVMLEAITSTAKRLGLGPYDITGEIRRILDELTLV